jgi:hypothetical protein
MRLSAKPIVNYDSINSFDTGNQWIIRAGDPNRLYFQLVDLDKVDSSMCKIPLRYVPQYTTSQVLQVTFPSLDDAAQIVATAAQVAGDGSIFYVDLTPAQIPGSGAVQFSLTLDGVTRRFGVLGMMSVEYPDSDGSC